MFDEPLNIIFLTGMLGIIAEVLATLLTSGIIKKSLYITAVTFSLFASFSLLILSPGIFVGICIFISLFRLLNAFRVLSSKMHLKHLNNVTKRTSIYLISYQLLVLVVWQLSQSLGVSFEQWLYVGVLVSLLSALILLFSTNRNLNKSSLRPSDNFIPDLELPSVSVCIPARNETDDLAACLQSVVDSDYPKLEVLVLDDCSQDKTSEIIKGFAKNGVRFINGDKPKKGWLAKNQAYQTLSDSASGSILVFCGVDVRFGKKSLKTLVASMESRNKSMISVLPEGNQKDSNASIIQPIRYWWELALPRRLFNRPPVLSSFWAIETKSLKKFGGFKAVDNMVVPEAYFATCLAKSDQYSFMRSSGNLHVVSLKKMTDQWDTAVRVRYPQMRRRPEAVAILLLAEMVLLVLPFWLFVAGFILDIGPLWLLSGLSSLLYGFVHLKIYKAYRANGIALSLFLLPVSVIFEMLILVVSMYLYEFKSVIWKERDICIPVMQSIPKLPKA